MYRRIIEAFTKQVQIIFPKVTQGFGFGLGVGLGVNCINRFNPPPKES